MEQDGLLLETRDLCRSFGGVEAVSHIDFALAERELHCLIGPNGAGKSTFFKILTGQLKPNAGQVLFHGHDISGAEPHDISRMGIGIKTQVPNVFNGLTVRENLRLSARRHQPRRRANEIVDEVLHRVQIADSADRLVGQLSHGERQWTELGIVLAGEPELLLLDEPTAGMTYEESVRTAELIREINKTYALIVVEHDMQFIKMIAKRVTVLHQGKILVEDWIDNVLQNPQVRDIYLGKQAAA